MSARWVRRCEPDLSTEKDKEQGLSEERLLKKLYEKEFSEAHIFPTLTVDIIPTLTVDITFGLAAEDLRDRGRPVKYQNYEQR